jgi:hypothetical protein
MPRMFNGLESFSRFLVQRAAAAAPTLSEGVRGAGLIIFAEAYKTFGDLNKLQELAPATIDRREYLMTLMPTVGGADSPLLFTGKLRSELEFAHEGMMAGVGSPDPIMLWQEMGTAHIPPRPLLRISAQTAGWEVAISKSVKLSLT